MAGEVYEIENLLAVCSRRCKPRSWGRLGALERKAPEGAWCSRMDEGRGRAGESDRPRAPPALLLKLCSQVGKRATIFRWRKLGIFQLQNLSLEAPQEGGSC